MKNSNKGNQERIHIKRGIRWKLLSAMIGLIVGLLMTLTFIQISVQNKVLEKELGRRIDLMKSTLVEQGKILSDNLARQTENGIASFNFSNVTEVIKKTVKEYQSLHHIILMDSSGVAYTHTSKPELQQEKLLADEDVFAVSQTAATINEYEKDGTSFLEIIVPISIGAGQWGVLRLGFSLDVLNQEIIKSRHEIRKKIEEMAVRSILALVLFAAIGAAIVFFISTRLSRPLIRLTESARILAKGDFSAAENIRICSRDEIGILADSFTQMAKNLKISYEKLEDYSRTLEQKVEERTQELRNANEKLKELDKAKSDFLSTVSHELRTPLTSILGFTKIIKKKFEETILPQIKTDDKKTTKALRQVEDNMSIILSEGERLTTMINDVLDLAKIEAGKIEWKMEPLSISEIIEQAVAATSALFEHHAGIELILDVEANLPTPSAEGPGSSARRRTRRSRTTDGRRTWKTDPFPSSLRTVMVPPMREQNRWVIASPRPVPPYRRVVEASACRNGSNRRCNWS